MSDALREAIKESSMSYGAIERATGVKKASLIRFVRGERSLRLDLADKLAEHFGIGVQRSGRR